MRIILPSDQRRRLASELHRAGRVESGGQLFGEQLAPSYFKVTELTIQRRRGSVASFLVDVVEATKAAVAFFRRTGHNYVRHNYIGEWHSHPSFAVQPSAKDVRTMREIVSDGEFVGAFAVLMIARLDAQHLRAGAWLFAPSGEEGPIALEIQDDDEQARSHTY